MKIRIIGEPMFDRYGVTRAVLLLVKGFHRRGVDVEVVSSLIKPNVRTELEHYASVIDLGFKNVLFDEASTSFVEIWLREAIAQQVSKRLRKLIERGNLSSADAAINMSNTIAVESTAWYAQGPVFEAMEHARSYVPLRYSVPYAMARSVIKHLDIRLMHSLRKLSRVACANSYTMKRVYESLGILMDCIVYEPLDTELFRPTIPRPGGDYVLTYFGKETNYRVVKFVADTGVKIKAFGSKATSFIPRDMLKHPNIEALGHVTDEELADLYSSALFTLFPFTEEPFGYIPVESMACCTPVLTYNRQGPSETVVNGITGWLANSDEELIELAVRIWKNGYPSSMRFRCRERALEFDVKVIADEWIKLIAHVRG